VIALVLGGLNSAPASCDEEDIDTVGDGGRIIILLDGTVWKSLDPATSATWLSAETVLVCEDDKMINKDEDGETIDVVRVH
jgi:hypothetical protein